MAKNNNTEADSNSIFKTLGSIILIFAAFAILIAVINPNDSGSIDEGQEAAEDVITPETEQKFYVLEKYTIYIKPLLSDKGRENLEIVWNYIKDDPTVLELDYFEHPDNIRAAYEQVKKELEYTYGSGERPEIGVEEGDTYTVTGELKLSDKESPLGDVYTLVDMNTNADLYFVFDPETEERIESEGLVGEDVDIEIEITQVEDMNVSYKVLSGPDLVESE